MAAESVVVDGERVIACAGIEQVRSEGPRIRIDRTQATHVEGVIAGTQHEACNFDALPVRLDGRSRIDGNFAGLRIGQTQDEVQARSRGDGR